MSVTAYADGACSGNPGPAGIGVTIDGPDGRVRISEYLGHGTNNIAELMAILRALEYCPSNVLMTVYTDSIYAIGVLSKGWKAKANQALVSSIKGKLQGRKVDFVHVRGHSGNAGNEAVDRLARRAVETRESFVEKV